MLANASQIAPSDRPPRYRTRAMSLVLAPPLAAAGDHLG
jgi:hypothetical protein